MSDATLPTGTLYRLSAFTRDPSGGNPAGVWIGSALPAPEEMQRIAADVGYSETAFIAPASGHARTVRYYSPLAEVTFCGHATIASGVVLGRRDGAGDYVLDTLAGPVNVRVAADRGDFTATLTSVDTQQRPADAVLEPALAALGWRRDELTGAIPPVIAYAGAWHLVLAVTSRERLRRLDYDFDALKELMEAHDLTTLQLAWRESDNVLHSRNPFPVGGVVEDPATGASAAALGGYLRDAGLVAAPFEMTIRQGEDMGRPSLLAVSVPAEGGIDVTGTAVDIPA